jgi:hypothetical protein
MRPSRAILAGALTAIAAVAAGAAPARADGELAARGMYYKEQSTRVIQPMLDASFDVGERGVGDAHFLVDAITSASTSAGGGGVSFTERRYQAGATYRRLFESLRLGGTARYSTEPDYKSFYGALHGDLELFAKNLTLSATLGAGRDRIQPAGSSEQHSLTIVLGALSVSQLVSEHGVVGVSYDLIHLDGYQENPYRRVQLPPDLLRAEHHPSTRTRHALAASLKWFFPSVEMTVIGQYRFYADDWEVHAHTPELRLVKDLGEWMLVGARYRYHHQDAADFYRQQYTMEQEFMTDDFKLAGFDSHLIGARFELTGGALGAAGRLEQARVELVGEYIVQPAKEPPHPNAFGNALVSYVAVVLPFEY